MARCVCLLLCMKSVQGGVPFSGAMGMTSVVAAKASHK